jgi:hypothetical protein
MSEFLPIALALLSALLVYLGSPAQHWLTAPLSHRYGRTTAALIAVGALLTGAIAWPLTTDFAIVLTTQMACFVAFPFLGALWQNRRPGIAKR